MRGAKKSEVVSVTLPIQEPGKPISPFVKELTTKASDQLTIELVPKTGGTPVINGMRIEETSKPTR